MKKANQLTKALIRLTLLFVLIAAISFVAFTETKEVCTESSKCTQATPAVPSTKGGDMLWDGFSRRFVTLVTIK